MNAILKEIIERAETWPEKDQQKLAQVILDYEARFVTTYTLTPEQLKELDEGIAEADRGEFATDAEVEAMFAKYR